MKLVSLSFRKQKCGTPSLCSRGVWLACFILRCYSWLSFNCLIFTFSEMLFFSSLLAMTQLSCGVISLSSSLALALHPLLLPLFFFLFLGSIHLSSLWVTFSFREEWLNRDDPSVNSSRRWSYVIVPPPPLPACPCARSPCATCRTDCNPRPSCHAARGERLMALYF